MEEKKLKKEQDVSMFEYNSTMKDLANIARAEKDKLDHEIVLAKGQLRQLREDHLRRQSEFDQRLREEDQKFKNELSKRNNQMIDQENKMNLLYKDLIQRERDFAIKEERVMNIEADRTKLNNDRVEVEKLRVSANSLMAEADRKISEAHSLFSQANTRIDESKRLDDKNNIRNQELVKREDQLKADMKSLEAEKNHLNELRAFVEPKIVEIKKTEEFIIASKKEMDEKHSEVVARSEENKVILKALEDKKSKLDIREKQVRSTEEELKRKALMLGVKIEHEKVRSQ